MSSAPRDDLVERGWATRFIAFSVDVPPAEWLQPPLRPIWSRDVAPAQAADPADSAWG